MEELETYKNLLRFSDLQLICKKINCSTKFANRYKKFREIILTFYNWSLTRVISNPHLIDQKDEADGYKGAIQTEWPKFYSIRRSRYCNGVKHGKILKQQRQPRQVARALVGKLK